MLDDQVARLQLHLVVGAKPEVVVLAFGRRVDPSPLVAAEWALLVVVGDDVLTELWTDGFQPVAEVPDDRERPEDGVLTLRQIVDRNCNQENDRDGNDPDHEEVPATSARDFFAAPEHHRQSRVSRRSLPNVLRRVNSKRPSAGAHHLRLSTHAPGLLRGGTPIEPPCGSLDCAEGRRSVSSNESLCVQRNTNSICARRWNNQHGTWCFAQDVCERRIHRHMVTCPWPPHDDQVCPDLRG